MTPQQIKRLKVNDRLMHLSHPPKYGTITGIENEFWFYVLWEDKPDAALRHDRHFMRLNTKVVS